LIYTRATYSTKSSDRTVV